MGFMKKIWKPLAQVGASFIPGVGPAISGALGPILGGIGGAAASAYGESGKQGRYTQSGQSTFDQASRDLFNQQAQTSGFQEAIEDPYFGQFRRDLIPLVSQELKRAQQPIFGDPQKALFMQNLNDLATAAGSSLKQNLASVGGLESGALGKGLTDIETGRFGEMSKFFSQLPFMEEEARSARMSPLLSMASNWVGRAPISTLSGGLTTATGESTGTRTGTNIFDQTGTQYGPSFGKTLAGGLGALGADVFSDWLKNRKKNKVPGSDGTGFINPNPTWNLPTSGPFANPFDKYIQGGSF